MKPVIFVILFLNAAALLTAPTARAVMTEYGTTNRTVAVTNILPASDVRPLAAYFIFPSSATGSVAISRVTAKGLTVPLARHAFTNVASVTWFAPADFPIRRGESFAVSSTVARFTLQLETSTDGNDVERTDAPEWYDEGRPFTMQIAGGGGSTQVSVTNTAQLFVTNSTQLVVTNTAQIAVTNTTHVVVTNTILVVVTNSPQIVITNIVNVQGGGGGGPTTHDLDMAQFEVTNIADLEMTGFLDARGALAVPQQNGEGSPYRNGMIFFDTSVNQFKGYNGTQYVQLGAGSGNDNLGNGIATTNIDLGTNVLTATRYNGGTWYDAATLSIRGYTPYDNSGGPVEIVGGDGNNYAAGPVTIRGGAGDGSHAGANVTIAGGTGGPSDGTVVLQGNNSHGNGTGGILLELENSDLKVQTDGTPTIYTGTTESLTVADGTGGTVTMHFFKGLYTGHTAP